MDETIYKQEYGEYQIKHITKVNDMLRFYKQIAIFFIAVLVSAVAYTVITEYLPNFHKLSMYEAVPTFKLGEIGVIIEDKPIELKNPPVLYQQEILVPVDFIKNNIDNYIFWDENKKTLVITTESKVVKMKTDDLNSYINGKPTTINFPVTIIEGIPYISINLISDFYQLKVKYIEKTSVIIIDYKNKSHTTAQIVAPEVYVRQAATDKSPWLTQLVTDDEIYIYGDYNNYKYIRTDEGYLGYVKKEEIKNIQIKKAEEAKPEEIKMPEKVEEVKPQTKKVVVEKKNSIFEANGDPEVTNINVNSTGQVNETNVEASKINMLWRQSYKIPGTSQYQKSPGVNVVSPTWFHIINAAGDMNNNADKKYVDWAHKNGMKVWALVANPFTEKEMTHMMLSDTETREKIIRQLLLYADLYNLDGINIDFESLKSETGPYYIQFLRELAPLMKEQGLTLSVDVYVPTASNMFYNRAAIAKVADYVIVMTYDEHWSTAPVAGSVASADWVENGVKKMLREVPKEKLIMGIPFYTRLWAEKDGKLEGKPKAIGMETTQKVIKENNVGLRWLSDDRQFYGEYVKDGLTYKLWVENAESINVKMGIMKKYDLAGIAAWKGGMETPDIWNIIKNALKD